MLHPWLGTSIPLAWAHGATQVVHRRRHGNVAGSCARACTVCYAVRKAGQLQIAVCVYTSPGLARTSLKGCIFPERLAFTFPPPATRRVSAGVASRVLASSSRNRTSTLRALPDGPADDIAAQAHYSVLDRCVIGVLAMLSQMQGTVLLATGIGAHSRPAKRPDRWLQLNSVILWTATVHWICGTQGVLAPIRRLTLPLRSRQ